MFASSAFNQSIVGWDMSNVTQIGTSYDGNLGGLAGADAKCAARATAASLPATWKAMISIGGTNAKDRLSITMPIKNNRSVGAGGKQQIATGGGSAAGQIWNGSIAFDIGYDESGNTNANNTWTGSTEFGVAQSNHCVDWTNSTSGATGHVASAATSINFAWFSVHSSIPNCTSVQAITCIDGQ